VVRAALRAALLAALAAGAGASPAQGLGERWSELPKERKLLYVNLGMAAFITAWGVANWEYFQNSPHTTNEGWFGFATDDGGVDKLGHAYTSYLLTHVLANRYEAWGYDAERAGLYGTLSAFGVQAFMELGDSFSGYGFSYEDFLGNVAGSLAGYLSWEYPEVGRKIDFRIEYRPNFDEGDVFTDYEHHKYLLAFKLGGFDALEHTPLRFLELHAGYYARGYEDTLLADNERKFYVGLGINLSQIARETGHRKIASVLNFYQVPYTYAAAVHEFDD
jgi:hypothetical protein